MDLTDLTAAICDDLGIPRPHVELAERLTTDTQLGAYDQETGTIYIRRTAAALDKAFALAHELRHVWQIDHGWPVIGKPSPGQVSVSDYNLQQAEIDANAYAALVMQELFGVTPLFDGLPKNVVDKIRERADEIVAEQKGGKCPHGKN